MKLSNVMRQLGVMTLAGALVVGCASQPKEEPKPAATGAEAQQAADAIAAAKASLNKAGSVGGEWRDSGKMVSEAEKAAQAGDYAKAIELADEAKRQGELGYSQAMKEKNAGAEWTAKNVPKMPMSYTVMRGDSLSGIAAKPEIYGDKNQWRRIYDANRNQLNDPASLSPGQVLTIPR